MKQLIVAMIMAMALGISAPAQAQPLGNYNLETIVEGLDSPWGLAILPNGDIAGDPADRRFAPYPQW